MNTIILRFGELWLKGNNRNQFERLLVKNIKQALSGLSFKFLKTYGRYVVSNYLENEKSELIERLTKIFGLVSLSESVEVDASINSINEYINGVRVESKTFRVTVNRADKRFPIASPQFAAQLGGIILENQPNLKVELYKPETEVTIDIRENGKAYIFDKSIPCVGGLPLGSSGKGLLLLSGGIDSPVAGFMMSKRGLKCNAIHFHSYPYTSINAKEKVIDLANILKTYTGSFRLHMVKFTEIQEEIHKKCSPEFMITIMRRLMMRISEKLAMKYRMGAIITGESLGQVASQTMQSMTVTNSVLKLLPVFRPLVGMDKEEIVEISQKIGTFETSILPYEDCCTVFLPKNPVIKPSLLKCLEEESKLDIDDLVKKALESVEVIII